MLIRRSLVAVSLIPLVVAGLAVQPATVAAALEGDPSLLEPQDVPLVPAVPLPSPDYEKADSELAKSSALPEDVGDLPGEASAKVQVDGSWQEVPEVPVEVKVEEPATPIGPDTDQPDGPKSDNEDDGASNVPGGAELEVELTRPADEAAGPVLLLDLAVAAPAAPEVPEEPAPSDPTTTTGPSAEPSPGEPTGTEGAGSEPSGSPETTDPEPDPTEEPEPSAPPETTPESDALPAPAEGVSVRLSYAEFDQLYGARWGARLGVVAYPACFATTPEEPGCAVGTPVESANDPGTEELTFTTIPAAVVADRVESSPEAEQTDLAPQALVAGDGGGVVYALVAGPGSFEATPFNSATSWQAGTGSGEFAYSYPFELPVALGGETPTLSLNYSSANVDTMTAQNMGASAVGTGWSEMAPGFISRTFATCDQDQEAGEHEFDDLGDKCWSTRELTEDGEPKFRVVEEMSLSMSGRSSRLRLTGRDIAESPDNPDVVTDEFRLYDDPGWRVWRRTDVNPTGGGALADNDAERWIVTTPDGVKYHFGTRPGANSTWTVPVFGNDPGEPCRAATMAGSVCQQAWQWNLDRVVDPHGNEIHYNYAVETNRYKRFGASSSAQYHRAGTLSGIEYGFWTDPTDPSDTVGSPRQAVTISTAPRCLPALSNPGASCPLSGAGLNRSQWTDVPIDLICAGTSCTQTTPSFFSTRRYHQVDTFTYRGGGSGTEVPVSVYELEHTLPDIGDRSIFNVGTGGDNVEADLWLQSVQLTGKLGGQSTTIPHAYFEGKIFDNKITQAGSAEDKLERFRLFALRNELGGRIEVSYGHQNPCDASMWNRQQVWWNPGGEVKACFATINPDNDERDWFHKYLVTRVVISDDALRYRLENPNSNLGTVQVFDYDYRGKPAWRFGASRNVPNDLETWNDWRGYEETFVHSVNQDNQPVATADNSITRTVRYRGMNRSRINPAGDQYQGVRIDTAEDGDGDPGPLDEPWLNGMTAETALQHPNRDLIERDYTGYRWWTMNTPQDFNESRRVYTARTINTVRTTSGPTPGERQHVVDYETFDGGANHRGIRAGVPKSTWDHGNPGSAADDTCAVVDHTTNEQEWMYATSEQSLHEGACTAQGTAPGERVSFAESFYDGQETAPSQPLTRGLLTQTTVHTADPSGNADEPITTQTDYDQYGRVVDSRTMGSTPGEILNQTQTEYNPSGSAGDLLTETKTTQVQDPGPDLVTRTILEPAKGLPIEVIDPNQVGKPDPKSTRMSYDGIGRPVAMYAPRNDDAGTPTIKHTYTNSLRDDVNDPPSEDKPARVLTQTQLGGPSSTQTVASYGFLDGWGRPIETHEVSPTAGRLIVTSTGYDDQGLAGFTTAPYSVTTAGAGEIVNPPPAAVPEYSVTRYDAAGRPTAVVDRNLTTTYRTSTTAYQGDRTVQVPADSGATITSLDVYDRPTKVELHNNAAGTNLQDAASYAYTPTGQLAKITKTLALGGGPTAPVHEWTYSYDWADRKTQAKDPDTGRTEYHYDPAGNLTQTDTYKLNNQQDAKIATEYDDLNRPTIRRDVTSSATRDLATWTYDTTTEDFNGLGRLTETTSTINTGSGGISPPLGGEGEYTQAVTGYDEDGNVKGIQARYPAWLTGEAANYPAGAPDGIVARTTSSTYTATGDPLQVTYPATPVIPSFKVNYTYEPSGGRLATMKVDGTAQTLADARYDALGRTSTLSSYNTTDATLIRSYTYDAKASRPEQTIATRTGPGTTTNPGTTNPTYLLGLFYQYDKADNPQRITASIQNSPGGATALASWCYDYDGLNRLSRAYTGKAITSPAESLECTKPAPGTTDAIVVEAITGSLYDLGYQYNGDRLWKVTTPGAGTPTSTATYAWAGTNTPHRTNTITRSGPNAPGLPATTNPLLPITYDGVGNATRTPSGESFTYDNQGRLTQAISLLSGEDAVTSQYAYDADGMRIARRDVKKSCLTCLRTTTVFLPDGAEISRDLLPLNPEPGKPQLNSTRHITTPDGVPVASIDYQGITWNFADAANTIRLTRKQSTAGGTVSRPNYHAHGAPTVTNGPGTPGNRGYLNKTHDPNGDIRLDQRNYTPTLNILTTPDPLFSPGDPQTLNPYSYARNNPIALADPTGLCVEDTPGCYNSDPTNDPVDPSVAVATANNNEPEPPTSIEDIPAEEFYKNAEKIDVEWEIKYEKSDEVGSIKTNREFNACYDPGLVEYCPTGTTFVDCNGAACGEWGAAWESVKLATIVFAPGAALRAAQIAYKLRKAQKAAAAAATAADDWPIISGIVRAATRSKGNFGLGSGTALQATRAGKSWVGEGYRIASDGKTLVSRDGLRAFRPPSWKPNLGRYQANFERWVEGQVTRKPIGNGHLDITGMSP